MTVSIACALLAVMVTGVPASGGSTALFVCGTTCPRAHDTDIEVVMNQFVAPTHPNQAFTAVPVTSPGEAWPITGLLRLIGYAFGDRSLFGLDGAAWPDQPWWKLTGLFDLTFNQSVDAGVAALETQMANYGDDHLVISGFSQGAVIANVVKKRLDAQYTAATAPDIDFVLGGDPNLPNGGFLARVPGLYIPILDWTFNGPEPTDAPFDTVVFTRQYDGFADFPLYPMNVISLLNAVLGMMYVHTDPFAVSIPAENPTESPAYQGMSGRTSYYFFETSDLPLFGPLRSLGVPESVIDVFEPFFRVLVELGYDRTIPPWEPTPGRLIPEVSPAKVALDLVDAIGEGLRNAAVLIGAPSLPSAPAPVALAAPEAESQLQQEKSATSSETEPATERVLVSPNTSEADDVSTAQSEESDTAEPADEPTPPRTVVRNSLGAPERLTGRPHRGDDRVTETTAAESSATEPSAASADESESAADESVSDDSSDGGGDGSD